MAACISYSLAFSECHVSAATGLAGQVAAPFIHSHQFADQAEKWGNQSTAGCAFQQILVHVKSALVSSNTNSIQQYKQHQRRQTRFCKHAVLDAAQLQRETDADDSNPGRATHLAEVLDMLLASHGVRLSGGRCRGGGVDASAAACGAERAHVGSGGVGEAWRGEPGCCTGRQRSSTGAKGQSCRQ